MKVVSRSGQMNNQNQGFPSKYSSERQCPRHNAELQFKLGGKDENGHFFEEEVVTRDISECGGSFTSMRLISVGSTLRLADRAGFISMIRIAWGKYMGQCNTGTYGFRFVFLLEE